MPTEVVPHRGPRVLLARAMALTLGVAACGGNDVTGPEPPPSPPPPTPAAACHAINYPGANGGMRIQNAIDDTACSTVYIAPAGPDPGGVWLVEQTITLRSNLTVTTSDESRSPVLQAGNQIRMFVVDGDGDVTLRQLTLVGAKTAFAGMTVSGSSRVEFTQGRIVGMTTFGIVVRDDASSQIRVNRSTFEDNGLIDIRTQTGDRNTYHASVVVENNTLLGSAFGIAFADCGGSAAAACQARNNLIKPKRSDPGSGVDLNRSHGAIVTGNRILGLGDTCAPGVTCRCRRGLTVDDTRDASITGNTIEGCTAEGLLLANGAVPENKPWWVSGNTVANNVVRNNGGVGLGSFRNASDPLDHNIFNVFRNNRIENNAGGGCKTNAERNTFSGNGPQACPNLTSASMAY